MFLPLAFEISLVADFFLSLLIIEIRLKVCILNVLTLKAMKNINALNKLSPF